MTTYMISPRGTLRAREDLRAMLDAGELVAYRVRENGTLRLVSLLPVGSTGRDTAEWISEEIEDGRSLASVAQDLHVSLPTARRFLEALEITEEVEAGEWDELWAETHGFAYQPQADELSNEELQAVFDGEWSGPTPSLLAEKASEVDAGAFSS